MKISKRSVSVSAVALSALGIATTLGAPQAFADNSKVYPGSMCVQWGGPKFVDADMTIDAKVIHWSSVTNASRDASIFVDCPAVHDNDYIKGGWVRATDRHPDLNVSCGLYSVHRNTADSRVQPSPAFGNPQITTGGGNDAGVQELGFGRAGSNGISHYFFSCEIPPAYVDASGNEFRSEIHTYYVNEN